MIRKALGPLEAQTFLQAQLPELEVEGRASRSPRHDTFRGAKVAWLAPGAGQRRVHKQSVSGQGTLGAHGAIPPGGTASVLLCAEGAAWLSSPSN